ncbi:MULTISPECIES: hypothetical protein [unclassified Bradyrhizobium]|uniref:hypothetical protein n=1 Tax=unclassified Bradyrhizobium TaxID=2631580 RepID=UPI00247870BF|nr:MULTISPECIES: hypothetical protein [unclassified Bradyrhizobium]WGR70438.1 hypothetical protein MTX24_34530 [Bradyrhizobium sp. ISRA426]WGR82494.1 hypothetical protein MTX21_19630 [Bradyrhizobium sp. ISRA430]WGR85680.1 hypothetical protein MTX25_34210 [Bradyrhizobium sp. ISRA432]
MGVERMHRPKYWQMRAEEFHAKADNCEHRQTKDSLRKVAQAYDDLARRARQIRTVEDLEVASPCGKQVRARPSRKVPMTSRPLGASSDER